MPAREAAAPANFLLSAGEQSGGRAGDPRKSAKSSEEAQHSQGDDEGLRISELANLAELRGWTRPAKMPSAPPVMKQGNLGTFGSGGHLWASGARSRRRR